MALSKDDILNAIADMSVMEVVELVSAMEEKFGVSAAVATPTVEYQISSFPLSPVVEHFICTSE